MTRIMRRLAPALAAAGALALGALGTYSYGNDYALHRGFAPVARLAGARAGRLLDVSFYSSALHRRADYIAYLPPGYTTSRRYPVSYLLHGMPGHPAQFITVAHLDVRLDNLIATHQVRPMILVFPDGRIDDRDYSDSEWANTPTGDYASYVLDVVRNVDARFSTLDSRQGRVIGGFSAGAYGALNIALHHLTDFASVQAWSGYFVQTRSGVFAHAGRAVLADNSPYDEVARLAPEIRRHGLRVVLYGGRSDPDSRQLPSMVARLRAAGARVSGTVYPGGHDWALWVSQLDPMLRLASQDMGTPPPTGARAAPDTRRAAVPASHPAPRPVVAAVGSRRGRRFPLLAALMLALVAGTLVNLGFVLQHRAAHRHAHERLPLLACARDRVWLAGQCVGWLGWLGAIVAVALAPLTLVQGFAAASLALSTPLAAWMFGARVTRAQLSAVALVAASLLVLAIGTGIPHHPQLDDGVLIAAALGGGVLVAGLNRMRRTGAQAVAAGVCYGIADAAIKADAIGLRHHGITALAAGWTVLAAAATLGGFLSFQAALRRDGEVTAISLMNAFATVTAVALGLAAFGETLGGGPVAPGVHLAAIAVVLACVWPLAGGQRELAGGEQAVAGSQPASAGSPQRTTDPRTTGGARPGRPGPAGRAALVAVGGPLAVVMCSVAGVGLLYLLHDHGWLGAGPAVDDALPLLALAGLAGQSIVRMAIAFMLCGFVLSLALSALRPAARLTLVALVAATTLLVASDASFALAHNLRFTHVLVHRAPGLGPWLEAVALVVGCAAADAARTLAPHRRRAALGAAVTKGPSTPRREATA